jgi:membrane protease YdiL (CAAX protease family)
MSRYVIPQHDNAGDGDIPPADRAQSAKRTRLKIGVFLTLTALAAAIPYFVMIRTGSTREVVLFWMWSPAVSALVTQWIFKGGIRDLGWGIHSPRFMLLAYAVPFIYACLIYGSVWLLGLGGFQPVQPVRILLFATLGLVAACMAALGEELGWRGLLFPELSRVAPFGEASLTAGVVWAIWHYPAVIFADYHSQAARWLDLLSLSIAVIGLSFFTGWLRIASGSIWPCVIWHGAHNLFIQQIFYEHTIQRTLTHFFIDDFGLGVMLASFLLGAIAWRLHERRPRSAPSAHRA